MEKNYDALKADIDLETRLFVSDDAKEIRFAISRLQSDQAYYQYRIFLIQKRISELDKEYQKVIGVVKDETVKEI